MTFATALVQRSKAGAMLVSRPVGPGYLVPVGGSAQTGEGRRTWMLFFRLVGRGRSQAKIRERPEGWPQAMVRGDPP